MNGIAERANRTITETARGLLIEARLPDYFWPDVVRSACVAKNRALTHVGAEKWVPNVEWIGRKPNVDMLRVFGCMCMALVPKHLRHNKLGAKAIWTVHLGMAQNSKGWLLWDPLTKKFLVSRDCKFMENLMYKDWKAENEAKIGMRFGEVKSSGLEHVELPFELSSGSTTTRQSSLVNGGEEAKDAEEEEEEVQQLSEPKSTLAGAALIVGDDEESDHDECAFVFFSPVEMPGEPATLKEALESSDVEEWKKAMESELKSIEENGMWELVELPEGRKAITSKWAFKIKSEYMALFRAVREIVWQRRLLAELGEEQQGPTPLYCDSQGAIAFAKNPVLHGLTKHMRVKWHWTRSMVAAGEVELHYVKTTRQPADMMTKRLVEQQHWKCCKLAGMALN
ncbi:unnamed protein product [Closterium sp. NIES-54]